MRDKCPECKSKNLAYDGIRGEITCKGCGLVIEEGGMLEVEFNNKSNIKVSSHLKDKIRERESKYQTKEDKKEIIKCYLKKTIESYREKLRLPKSFEEEAKLIILEMHRKGQLSGFPYELSILSVILHLCLKEDFNISGMLKDSLGAGEREIKTALSPLEKKTNKFKELFFSIEEYKRNLMNLRIDLKDCHLSQKRIQDVLNFLPNKKDKIISRLRNYIYSKNILTPPIPFFFSLEQVKYMDEPFLEAFGCEEGFLNLLKSKGQSNKKRILELRNQTPKYALRYIFAMKIPEERRQQKYSNNWKGLFCTCFYYLIKDYFKEEFKENCPTQSNFLNFFGIGKKNFIYYLRVFRVGRLDSKIFKTSDAFYDLEGL